MQPLPWSFALLLLDFFCWTRCFLSPFPHIPPSPHRSPGPAGGLLGLQRHMMPALQLGARVRRWPGAHGLRGR